MTAIKPVHDIAKGAKEFVEDDEDRSTYTLGDLKEIAEDLATNYAGFREYIAQVGLVSSAAS